MRTFRAATINIWSRFGPWEARIPALRAELANVDADVVGMQEVLRFPGFDHAAVVSEGLGYHVAWGKASDNHGYPDGNAILSKWPIVKEHVFELPNGGSDESRSLLYALIDAPFGKLPFFCTHLNWKLHHSRVRQLQVHAVATAIEKLAPLDTGFPPVLVGDFNAPPDADEIRFLKGLHSIDDQSVYFADSFELAGDGSPGATFAKSNPHAEPLREPDRRIDYVFVRGPDDAQRGEPLACNLCFDRPYDGMFPSDHYGVVATITAGR